MSACDRFSTIISPKSTLSTKSRLRSVSLDQTNHKELLFKAVHLRHDCVHRNGFDKNGNELTDSTRSFVQQTADVIENFAESIQTAVNSRPRLHQSIP